jgi:uncharacterized protein YdgA (DUF945 family)
MKKLLVALLALALLAASAYAASAWYIGKQVEVALADPYKALEGNPYVKIVRRDYQRGVFTSTETVKLEILGDIARAAGGEPMVATSVSRIQHGPLTGNGQMASAVVDTEVRLAGGGLPAMPGPLVKAHSVIDYEGNGESRGTLEPTVLAVPDATAGGPQNVSLGGGEFSMQFTPNMAQSTGQASLSKIEVELGDGGRMVMSGLRVSESTRAVFPDTPGLRAGTQKFAVDEVRIDVPVPGAVPVVARGIVYDANMPVNGEFLDFTAKAQVADILVGGQNYGPAHLDMSGRRLHARSVAELQKAIAGLQAMRKPKPGTDPMAALQPMMAAAMGVLRQDPEIRIDRFSFNTASGEVMLTAKVQVPGVTAEDAQNVMALGRKVVAVAELAVPEALLMMPFGPAAASPEMAAAQLQGRQRQIAGLLEQGYLFRDGALMKSKLELRAGQVAINGLPFDPLALQGRTMPSGPAMMPPARPQMLPNVPVRR